MSDDASEHRQEQMQRALGLLQAVRSMRDDPARARDEVSVMLEDLSLVDSLDFIVGQAMLSLAVLRALSATFVSANEIWLNELRAKKTIGQAAYDGALAELHEASGELMDSILRRMGEIVARGEF